MNPTHTDYIPIPWRRRLQRMQCTALPVVSFVACIAAVLWLWQRQGRLPNSVGEVDAVRVDLVAGSDGMLVSPSYGQWALFDHVEANAVIARLDDRPVLAEMATLSAELVRLRQELDAAAENLQTERSDREHDHLCEHRQLVCQCQQCRLDVLDRRAVIEAARVERKRLDRGLTFLESLRESGTATELRITDQRLKSDAVQKRIEENEKALAEAERQYKEAEVELLGYPDMPEADAAKLLKPLEAAITVGERRVDELRVRIDGLEICSPVSGTICAVHKRPGQFLKAGDPVVTVAADRGHHIVSYVRQEQRVQPAIGMPVEVRVRGSHVRSVTAAIDHVGPQIQPVPLRQLQDASRPEWGLPVFIPMPSELLIRPGELVDIRFETRNAKDSGRVSAALSGG